MSNAPDIPSITNVINVSIPRNPNGLTNLAGNENFIAVPLTGTAIAGPASLQAAPSNTLPKLDFEQDSDGNLWISPPTWGVSNNGVVGYGRFIK